MQAIKAHSPNIKKAQPASATLNANAQIANKSDQTNSNNTSNNNSNSNKSVAQRVMEVASNNAGSTGILLPTCSQLKPTQPTMSAANELSSSEPDVEGMATSLAATLDLAGHSPPPLAANSASSSSSAAAAAPSAGQQQVSVSRSVDSSSSSSNTNNNTTTNNNNNNNSNSNNNNNNIGSISGALTVTVQKYQNSRTDSKSPSLLLDSPTATSTATAQHSPMNIQQQQQKEQAASESVFRQIVAKSSKAQHHEQTADRTFEVKRNQQQQQQQHFRESVSSRGTGGDLSGSSSVSFERDSSLGVAITLDSKVPLPSKANTICDGDYHEANPEEEVRYYNDQATATASLQRHQQQLDSHQQLNGSSLGSCSSINNNNSNSNSSNAVRGISSASNKTRAFKSLAAKQGHKLSVIVPTNVHTNANCQQLKQHQQNNNYHHHNYNHSHSHNHHHHQQHNHLFNPNSREYLNELDEVEDDYDSRYENAMVDEKTAFGYDEQQQQQQQQQQQNVEMSASPKAKSAPATPCNVTPTAFHQNTSHLSSMLNGQSQANTLPPDIRMTISNTSRVLPSSLSSSAYNQLNSTSNSNNNCNSAELDELIQQGDFALEKKDYSLALRLYSKCIDRATRNQNFNYLTKNYNVYSQRAEANFYLQNYNEAIEDSMAARGLNPKCTQAYYRQGRAQFLLGQHENSLAVFSFGLAQDPTSKRLFEALLDAALRSNFKEQFEPKYKQLVAAGLDKKPFVVVSLLGQEVLAHGHGEPAAVILESALKLSADDKNVEGSVLSAVSYAYCLLKNYDKAISYMQRELDIVTEREDVDGQCRVLNNLGSAYYKVRKFDKSLEAHRKQMSLAMRTQLYEQAWNALNSIGHVHAARNDFTSALTSHTRCLEILRQLNNNDLDQFRQLLSIGHIHTMLGDYKSAEEKYNEAIQLLKESNKIKKEDLQIGLVMVNFNFAYLALKKQSFFEAKHYYETVIKLSEPLPSSKRTLFEMRASNGMGQMYRLFKKFDEAQRWFESQLQLAVQSNDMVGRSQALCNLGMTYQHFKDYEKAWNMFDKNLRLVDKDPLLKAYAHSYMASMYFLEGKFSDARAHYESSLNIFKDLGYCSAEKKTIDLNMAAVCERMGHSEINLSNSLMQQRKVLA